VAIAVLRSRIIEPGIKLEHVRVVDPAGQATAKPQVDHPLEAIVVRREQGAQRLLVAGCGPPQLFGDQALIFGLRVVHTL